MARPKKIGLPSFPLDVDIFSDEKTAPITDEFGAKGQIIIIHLLIAIYRSGYYIEWDNKLKLKLAQSIPSVSPELLTSVVTRLVKCGFFDAALFENAHVLTSQGIQQRYFSAVRRRKAANLNPLQHLLCPQPPRKTPEQPPAGRPPRPQPPPLAAPQNLPVMGCSANKACLERFFHPNNSANLDALCKNFGLAPSSQGKLRRWAERIVTDWNISEKSHRDYSDWAQHLIRLMWNELRKDEQSPPPDRQTPRRETPPPRTEYSFNGGFGGQDV